MDRADQQESFESVHARLQEIVEAVSDDSLPLDDALDLYEEAVALGLRVSDLLEEGITVPEGEDAIGADAEPSVTTDEHHQVETASSDE